MSDKITEKAIAYWQDSLAKFFPGAKGPSGSEFAMFRAGYQLGQSEECDAWIKELETPGCQERNDNE